jgi:hypothetical protein
VADAGESDIYDTRKSPLSGEVLGEDQFARTGAAEKEVLAWLRAGMGRTVLFLLAVLGCAAVLEKSYL